MKSLKRLLFCLGMLLPTLVGPTPSAHAATSLSKFAIGTLEFSLDQINSTSFRITLHPKGGVASLSHDLTANVFAISGPSRLVIDVPGFSFGLEKKDKLTHEILQGIRVGSHPDKTRFVVDIADEAKPEYQVRTDIESESIVISFEIDSAATAVHGSQKNSSLTNKQATSTEEAATAQNSDATSSNNATVGDADTLLLEAIRAAQDSKNSDEKGENAAPAPSKKESSKEPTTEAKAATSDTDADDTTPANANQSAPPATKKSDTAQEGTVVTAIQFMQWPANNSGAVVIEVSNPEEYQLLPQGEDRYELRLDNAKLGASHLVIPQFPPEDFREFDVVMARQTGDTVVIQVYITKGVKLYPAKVDDRIWLKTSE